MAISDIPVLSVLRTRMQWHQERQRVLSENVANADTPGFKPKELKEPDTSRASLAAATSLTRTDPAHIALSTSSSSSEAKKNDYEVRPSGNAVNLEDEMMKVAQNQMDYQAATTLYTKSLGLLKTAIGRSS